MATNLLDNLKDIHQPAKVSIFPLAPSWYLLLALLVILASIIIWLKLHKKKKAQQIKQIYSILGTLEQNCTSNKELLADISILLKRVAMWRFPDRQVQLKFGNEWLVFLDQTGKTTEFSSGIGKCLANSYQFNANNNDYQALFNLIKKWLRIVL